MPRLRKEPNRYWSKEDKLRIVKKVTEDVRSAKEVAKEEDISYGMLKTWVRKYLTQGVESLENKRKPGNPLCKYSNKKNLSDIEKLEYENMKLRIEVERLKKGYQVKGDGQKKEFIITKKKNSK